MGPCYGDTVELDSANECGWQQCEELSVAWNYDGKDERVVEEEEEDENEDGEASWRTWEGQVEQELMVVDVLVVVEGAVVA